MGFDYGTKRIGVAVGNCVTFSASRLTLLSAKQGKPNWQELELLIKQWQPQRLIVGYPTQEDGSDFAVTPKVQKFARQLQHFSGLPVELFDERLSSHEARELNKPLKQKRVDDLAAQIILQSWLNHHQQNKQP